jgi:LPXTG-motif cell wall-anchored protein
LKIHRNNKLAGCLLIASGLMFFVSAAMMRQPAFTAVGIALLVIGASVLRKNRKN